MTHPAFPPAQGLYDPAHEHDSCGVGFVAHIKGKKSHAIVEQGLTVLKNLTHRGAVGWDPKLSDGAGCLIQIPDKFFREESLELKGFLRDNLYRHYRVVRMSAKARRVVADLFGAMLADTRLLPPEFQTRARAEAPRAIADYIAGMTDRYAILEHRRLFSIDET